MAKLTRTVTCGRPPLNGYLHAATIWFLVELRQVLEVWVAGVKKTSSAAFCSPLVVVQCTTHTTVAIAKLKIVYVKLALVK